MELYRFNPSKSLPRKGVLIYVGRTNSGKTFLMRDHLYHLRNDFDIALAMIGSKDTAYEFEQHIPAINVYDTLDLKKLTRIYEYLEKQKSKERRGMGKCPRVVVVIDDMGYKRKNILTSEVFLRIFFNCRHVNMLMLISVQDCKLVTPSLRGQVRQVFLCQEKNPSGRKRVYEAFNPGLDSFQEFDKLFKRYTINYGILVLNNELANSYDIEDNVFIYKAKDRGKFRVNKKGSMWNHNKRNLNKNHDLK